MRIPEIVALCAVLGGCAGSPQGVAVRYGDQFIGKNVDALVAQIGRPTSSKRMDDGQGAYVWQLTAATDLSGERRIHRGSAGLYGDGYTPGYISDDPGFCKVSVVTSPEGIVIQLNAEDSNGTGAPTMTLGLNGSICAQRFQAKSQT
jgi:hypothetical protein